MVILSCEVAVSYFIVQPVQSIYTCCPCNYNILVAVVHAEKTVEATGPMQIQIGSKPLPDNATISVMFQRVMPALAAESASALTLEAMLRAPTIANSAKISRLYPRCGLAAEHL